MVNFGKVKKKKKELKRLNQNQRHGLQFFEDLVN